MTSVALSILDAYLRGRVPRRLASGAFWRLAQNDAAVGTAVRTARVNFAGSELTLRLRLNYRQNWAILFERVDASDDAHALGIFVEFARRSRCVWDVGANVGIYFLTAAVTAPRGAGVYAVEPQPELADMLRDHVVRNGLASAHVVEAAVSDHAGEADLLVPESDRMATLDSLFLQQRNVTPHLRQRVQLITLDSLADEAGCCPDLLKIDVEGHEEAAIRGASGLLRQRPTVLLEISSEHSGSDVVGSLFEYGYTVSAVGPRRSFPIRTHADLVAHQERSDADTGNYLFTTDPL